MTELRQALEAADASLRRAVDGASLSALSDADLMSHGGRIEAVARLLDAARVLHAAEVARRAETRPGMVAVFGFRGPVDAVAGVMGISGGAARQRIRTGTAITQIVSPSGAVTQPRFPIIASAVRAGSLGVEAAGLMVAQLQTASPRVDPAVLRAAEESLVAAAAGDENRPPLTVDLVRGRAAAVVAEIDPDGLRSRAERARSRRSLRFGREDSDGLTPVHGSLLPVVAARFRRLCDAHMKAARPVFVDRVEDADALNESNAEPSSADSQSSETRTREQQRHDVLGAILDAAGRVADAPHLAGAPPAILVTVTKEALDQGSGVGVIDGMDTPVSVETVAQLADTGGSQPVTLDAAGALLSMGSVQRCFTPSQRRAITVRDGGCLIPGCPIPAGWCEVHHVIPYRAGGATHVHNGVLLCWWHHHIIDSGPWRLRMHRGVPQVRGPGIRDWTVATKRRIDPPPINAPCRGPDPGRRGLHPPPGSVPSPQDHGGP